MRSVRVMVVTAAVVVGGGLGSYAIVSSRIADARPADSALALAADSPSKTSIPEPAAALRSSAPASPSSARARATGAPARTARTAKGTGTHTSSSSTASRRAAQARTRATAAGRVVERATARPHCTTTLGPSSDLAGAVAHLGAGRAVCLRPGAYRLAGRLVFPPQVSGTASAPAVLAARDGLGSVTIDAGGSEEALYFTGARHVIVQGLRITGGAYHGVKIDSPSSDLLLAHDAIFDNFRAGDGGGQYAGVKGCCLAQRVTIEDSEIYYTHPGPGSNNQGIDCNGCKNWVVRGNRVHGIHSQQGGGNAVQFKSGSSGTVVEDNLVYGNFLGISYGGFGNPALGQETYEHVGGMLRNNVIYGNTDAGISVINTLDGRVFNNTLFGNGFTPDVRVKAVGLRYQNNILDHPLNLRDGTTADAGHNVVLASDASRSVFVDAPAHDFRLRRTAKAVVGRGLDLGAAVPTDARGRPRPHGHYDVGAFQH